MKNNNVYDRIRARAKPETRRYVRMNMAIAMRVADILKNKDWTQKDLAKKMGKAESEVSKWLSGSHNLTLKSIAKMEAVLEADVLNVAQREAVRYVTFYVEKSPTGGINEQMPKTATEFSQFNHADGFIAA